MDKNIIEQIVVPYNPPSANVVQRNQYNLFAPIGGINRVGMVGYSADDFVVKNNILSISANAKPIADNTKAIAENAEAVAKNAEAVAKNTEAIGKNIEAVAKNTEAIGNEVIARKSADKSIEDKFDQEVFRLSSFIDSLAEDRIVTKVLTEDDSKLGTGVSVVQVGAALKYGLVNYVSGNTKYIRTWVLYDLNNVKTYGGTKLERVGNTVIFPRGNRIGVYVPVTSSVVGGTFLVCAYGKNDSGEYWLKVTPVDSNKGATGGAATLGSLVNCGDDTSLFQISKYNANAISVDDIPLYDIRIEGGEYPARSAYEFPAYDAKVYEIPQAVRDLCVNGLEDTINLIDRKIELYGGGTIDISEYITEDFCEIPLMSSSIVRFEDEYDNAHSRFKITYKERIHGN